MLYVKQQETPVYTELKRESEEEKGEKHFTLNVLKCLLTADIHFVFVQSPSHFSAVAFNLGASSCVAGPSKSRYRSLCRQLIIPLIIKQVSLNDFVCLEHPVVLP